MAAVASSGFDFRVGMRLTVAGLALLAGPVGCSAADTPGPARIYSCTDASGKRLTSDRPILECATRDQRVLNADGSVRQVVPPTPTADESAEMEARERAALAERSRRQEAIRRDRNLLSRYPNEAAHRKARESALDDVRKALRLSETRTTALAAERKPLLDEAEFYVGKPLPARLKQQLDANDASVEAQRALVQNQQAEVVRINALYDSELERLRKLWNGAPPGSLGVLTTGLAEAAASSGRSTQR